MPSARVTDVPVTETTSAWSRSTAPRRRARSCIAAVPGPAGHDRAAVLVQPDGPVRQRELRPPLADRVDAEQLEVDADLGQRVRVVDHRDRRIGREQVEPADHGHQLAAGVRGELRPVVVGVLGQPDVLRRVVAVPQDPAGVVARAAAVPELEPLQPEHRAAPLGELVGRRRAERAEPDDDVVEVLSHHRPRAGRAASAGCPRSRPPSARTSRACTTATTSRAAPTRRSPSPAC